MKVTGSLIIFLIFSLVYKVSGHARLMNPPSRASMWRVGFGTPADYNDNEGFCGGFQVSKTTSTQYIRMVFSKI